MIQHFTQGPTRVVQQLNQLVDEANKFSRVVGDGIVQVQRTSNGMTIGIDRNQLAALVPKIGLASRGLSAGLAAWYLFNNGSAKDSSGNGNDGTLTGAGTISQDCFVGTGALNCGMSFSTADMNTTVGAIMCWANADTIAAGSDYAMGHYNAGNRIYMYRSAASFFARLGSSAGVDSGDDFIAGQWAHIGLVWNDGTYYIYWNGEQTGSGSYSGLTTLTSTMDVGDYGAAASTLAWDGKIDDARVYNRVPSAYEIRQIYEEGNKRFVHANEFYGRGTTWRARTTEAAGAAANLTCNLIINDGLEAASGEFGYNIEVYCDICGGGNLEDAVPRLANDAYLSVYQSWHTDGTFRWYAATTFQASEDCACS